MIAADLLTLDTTSLGYPLVALVTSTFPDEVTYLGFPVIVATVTLTPPAPSYDATQFFSIFDAT